jgi:hypothetical protein
MTKKPDPDRTNGGRARRVAPLAVAGFVLFAASWFVPVVRNQGMLDVFGGLTRSLGEGVRVDGPVPGGGPDWLPGWSACRFAWELLTDSSPSADGERWKQLLCGATCLTNLVMLGAAFAAMVRGRSLLFGLLLLACAGVDASWVYLGGADTIEQLGAGYWMWLGSFVLAGLGLLRRERS